MPSDAPAPSAAQCLRARLVALVRELAALHMKTSAAVPQQAATGGSSVVAGVMETGVASAAASAAAPDATAQSSLVFELNRSGRYLALKQELKPLLQELAREHVLNSGGIETASNQQQQSSPMHTLAQLYVDATHQLQAALAEALSKPSSCIQPQLAAALEQQQPEQIATHQTQRQNEAGCMQPAEAVAAEELMFRAAECEIIGDVQRADALHQRRLVLLQDSTEVCGPLLTALQGALVQSHAL